MQKNNKILFLSPLPPPSYGSAMSSQTCLEILKENEHIIIKNIQLNYSKSFEDVGSFSFSKLMGFFFVFFKLLYHILLFRPRVVYIMPATMGFAYVRDFSLALLCKLFNKKIIFHVRTQITEKDKKNKCKNFIFKLCFKNSTIIVLGETLKKEINCYANEKNIYVLANAVAQTISEQEYVVLKENKKKEEKLELIFISNMMKSKGWDILLEAANILQSKNIHFNLTFAGNWENKADKIEFENFVAKNNLNKSIKHIGYVENIEKKKLLSTADIFILPTKYEAFSRAIIEAMEYGITVIANKTGSIPDIIENKQNGFLLSENSAQEIVDYILYLEKNRDQLITIGEKARKDFLSNYDLPSFKQKFTHIIEKETLS